MLATVSFTLYCIVMYCVVLCCIVLYYMVLYCIALCCGLLFCIVFYCVKSYYTTLHHVYMYSMYIYIYYHIVCIHLTFAACIRCIPENRQDASDKRIVNVSTVFGAAMTLGSFVVAPLLQHIDGIFSFQQHVMLG